MAEVKKTVKKPQDRKQAVEKPSPKPGVRVVEVQGITVEVVDAALDDFELMEDFSAIQSGETHRMPSAMRRMFGADYERILSKLRDPKTGRVSVSDAARFFAEVFQELAPNA